MEKIEEILEEGTESGELSEANPEVYKLIIDHIYDGIYLLDRNRIIRYWNKGAEHLTGYRASEVIGKSCADNILMHVDGRGKNLCKNSCPVSEAMESNTPQQAEVFLHHKGGYRLPVSVRVVPLKSASGRVIGAVELFSDNREKLSLLESLRQIEEIAHIDPLTQIANRRLLETHIHAKIAETKRYGWSHGLFFIDIDHFKHINDTFGHTIGDATLKMVAQTISNSLRSFDLAGRWGGEEFIVVGTNIKKESFFSFSERIRKLIEQSRLTTPMGDVHVTVSIGATPLKPEDTIQTAISRSDKLMYQSKMKGRNQTTVG